MRTRIVAITSFALFTLTSVVGVAAPARAAVPESPTGRYIVRFAPGADAGAEATAVRRRGGQVRHVFSRVMRGYAARIPAAELESLARNPRVISIEPDGIVKTTATQSGATWGLDRTDQRALPLGGTYTYPADGTGVTAYIVDTGVLASHVDFGGRVSAGFTSISDGNGTSDCNGHGTHVAGTVAGTTYGMAKAATIVPVRVLDCAGSGSWSGVIAGLDWIAAHHADGVPAVANMSLGGGVSSSVDAAVQAVINDGVTVAVAAGNDNLNACQASPARVPAAVTVGSTTNTDARSSFSNFGSCLDIFAPGSSITSAWHTSPTVTNTISGTSMATPHVAGAAAVLLSQQPKLTPAQVDSTLKSRGTANVVTSAGTGSPNLMLYADPAASVATAPAAPTNVTATAGVQSATVTWTQGANGGSALTGQTVRVFTGTTLVNTLPVAANATNTTVSGLTAGTSYTFTIAATNAVGTSPQSTASNAVVPTAPVTAPAAPTNVTATAGVQSATVSWTQGANGGSALTGQTLRMFTNGTLTNTWSIAATSTSINVTGLTAGTSYTFTVSATNAVGTSPQSATSNTVRPTAPLTAPAAPTNVRATAGKLSASVNWTQGSNGGSALTGQTLRMYRNGALANTWTIAATTTSVNVTGLVAGTSYSFTVSATNAVGTSPQSAMSNTVKPTR